MITGIFSSVRIRHTLCAGVFLVTLLVFCASQAVAGGLRFRQFSTLQGLPCAVVHHVAQDELGFIWLATTNGLYRYDGYEVVPYKSDAANPRLLPSNRIICLAASQHGHLWIGTQEGLCRMDLRTGRVRHYPLGGVDKQRVNSICITRQGRVYAGTIRGLAVYDARLDSLLHVGGATRGGVSTGRTNIQAVMEDAAGDLLVGTLGRGLYRYNPKEQRFTHYEIMPSDTIYTLCQTADHRIWLGTGRGIVETRFDVRGRLSHSALPARLSHVFALVPNPVDNTMLVGNADGLRVLSMADGRLSDLKVDAFVRSIFRDMYGHFWLATTDNGVFAEEPDGYRFTTLSGQSVCSVAADGDGSLWTAFNRGASGGNVQLLHDKTVMSVSPSRSTGNVFLSCWQDYGFYTARGGRLLQHYTRANCKAICSNSVHRVFEDRRGNWWIATNRGLGVRYADGREVRLPDVKGMDRRLGGDILDVAEDADGSLWVLTPDEGIVRLTGNLPSPRRMVCRVYDVDNGRLPVNTPLCMLSAGDGRLWLGTDGGGLCILDREKDRFELVHGQWHLPGDMVSSLEEDSQGCLWIGTNQGLARLQVSGNEQGRLRVYTTADGLPDNYFMERASCQADGQMYFGTLHGLIGFRADTQRPASGVQHQAAIAHIRIDGQSVSCPPLGLDTLIVPASANNFAIDFASLTFSGQHQCSYSYRLLGLSDQWNDGTRRRSAQFAHLQPGTYTFELRATDDEGNWSPVRRMTIIVQPPFWRTWWAYTLYIIIGAVLLYLMVRKVRSHMMIRNRIQLQVGSDGQTQVVVQHNDSAEQDGDEGERAQKTLAEKKQFVFEIHDINFTNADEEFLNNAVSCVNRNLGDCNFTIQHLWEELGTSRSTLFKRLKSLTGMSASTFIADIRLKAACRIMDEHSHDGAMRISDLAYQVGFNDPKYFTVCFRKKFGLSPREYLLRTGRAQGDAQAVHDDDEAEA